MSDGTEDRIAVLVGLGETIERVEDPARAASPLDLAARAALAADRDADGGLLRDVDALDVVSISSWRYADAPSRLAQMLNIAPAHRAIADVSGESPVRLVHEAALRIARGESRVALICGGEAQSSVALARKQGVALPWPDPAADGPRITPGSAMVHPLATRFGLAIPTNVYPLYDVASAAAWGQTNAEALAESGAIWSRYSHVAAGNPTAWLPRAFTAEAITTPSPSNRLIAWPYTKLMVANPMVNQGAAVIVTSLAHARRAGIGEDRMVFLRGGAAANEPRDFMARDQFGRAHAQDAVLESAMALAPEGFDAMELYSCFPCVPKMARRTLGLGPDVEPTVTGGLTFFGGPLSNYMLHAIAAMMRRVRDGAATGLVYGQGEFVTKHHAIVLTREPAAPAHDFSVQAEADRRRGPVPETIEPSVGPARVETATILHQRDGSVAQGVAILRTSDGARTMAPIAANDETTLDAITAPDRTPVGLEGRIVADDTGPRWTII